MTDFPDNRYPVLPLRDVVVFPHMVVPLFVGRVRSVKALDEVMKGHKRILLLAQKDAGNDQPRHEDMYHVGTLGMVLQLLKLPDGAVKVLVEGLTRYRIKEFSARKDFFEADTEPLAGSDQSGHELQALTRSMLHQFSVYLRFNKKISVDILNALSQVKDPSKLADTIAANLMLSVQDKQLLLETVSVTERLEKIYELMENEIAVLKVEKRIRGRVKNQMDKTQKEYYLNEQIKAIQKELGDGDSGHNDMDELEKKIKKTRFTKEARERVHQEMKKLKSMSPMSAEANVSRNYLDWLVSLPWRNPSTIQTSLDEAEKILDADHYGLKKIKERILEFIAVQIKTKKVKGPILCLVGPPGVGKTSLGESIARATGRPFVRMSLGGLRDESEIRGHRRTYIGSLPGKIIQGMRKAKHSNPLFLLDEVDKIGTDWRGDPASALLEVLDPEQNKAFNDHYLEVDYDLSDVLFVTTANTLNMPQPLLDRMECLRISGYTEDEKLEIAKRHLLPKQREDNGLSDDEWSVSDEAILTLIRRYTREAGLRNLERECAQLARKAVRKLMQEKHTTRVDIHQDNLKDYAGVLRFRYGSVSDSDLIGVTTGLAWTENGGDLLSVETVIMAGKGKYHYTGTLGDIMKESVQAAISFVRARATDLNIDATLFDKQDIHLHVPEGATPKDGPSAGIAIYCSIVSSLTSIAVDRHTAMTGEITLSGRVLPIGGLKEKMLAALRGGIKKVIIPYDNIKDLEEIPDKVKNALEIIPVKNAHEVLPLALTHMPTKREPWQHDETSSIAIQQEKNLTQRGDKTATTH